MPLPSATDVGNLLKSSPNAQVSQWSKDTDVIAALVRVFAATVDIAAELPSTKTGLAIALTTKAHRTSEVAGVANGSNGLALTNFVAGQTLETIGLLKVAGFGPARASAFITLTMANKVVAAAGLGQLDKCKMAIASLVVTTALAPVTCVGGITCAVGALAIASEAFNVYGKCAGR